MLRRGPGARRVAQGSGRPDRRVGLRRRRASLLTATLMDLRIAAAHGPADDAFVSEPVPSDSQPRILGMKGCGERHCKGRSRRCRTRCTTPVAPLGVTDIQMPFTPETGLGAIRDARGGGCRREPHSAPSRAFLADRAFGSGRTPWVDGPCRHPRRPRCRVSTMAKKPMRGCLQALSEMAEREHSRSITRPECSGDWLHTMDVVEGKVGNQPDDPARPTDFLASALIGR